MQRVASLVLKAVQKDWPGAMGAPRPAAVKTDLLVTRNGSVIGFQGVSAEAAVTVDFEAHDYEDDDHMSPRSLYWTVVSEKEKKKHPLIR